MIYAISFLKFYVHQNGIAYQNLLYFQKVQGYYYLIYNIHLTHQSKYKLLIYILKFGVGVGLYTIYIHIILSMIRKVLQEINKHGKIWKDFEICNQNYIKSLLEFSPNSQSSIKYLSKCLEDTKQIYKQLGTLQKVSIFPQCVEEILNILCEKFDGIIGGGVPGAGTLFITKQYEYTQVY